MTENDQDPLLVVIRVSDWQNGFTYWVPVNPVTPPTHLY